MFKLIVILSLFGQLSFAEDNSKYVPMCFQTNKKCDQLMNLSYVGAGKGTVDGYNQSIYSFGYLRRIKTLGGDDLYIGLELNGSEKNSLFGYQLKVGFGW